MEIRKFAGQRHLCALPECRTLSPLCLPLFFGFWAPAFASFFEDKNKFKGKEMLVLAAKVAHHSRSMGSFRHNTASFGHLARLPSTRRASSTETTKSAHQTSPPNGGHKEGSHTDPAAFPAPSFQREHSSATTMNSSPETTPPPPPSPMFASSPARRLVVLAGDGGTTLLARLMRAVGLGGWWDSAAKRWGSCVLLFFLIFLFEPFPQN